MAGGYYEADPYEQAPFLDQLKEHKTLAVLDYDRTLTTGEKEPSRKELNDQEDVWAVTAKTHAIDACISARTPGMMMDRVRYQDSVAHGYSEPMPRLFKNSTTEMYEYADPATIPFYKNAVNRKIIGSFGWGILVQNGHGYRVDRVYDQLLSQGQIHIGGASKAWTSFDALPEEGDMPWRLAAMAFLIDCYPGFREFLAPIESLKSYHEYRTDVAPLPYRIQLDFRGTAGYQKLLDLQKAIKRARVNPFAARLQLIDESRICEGDSEQSRYTTYLVPWYGRKENQLNRMLSQTARAACLAPKDIRLFYAGDSLTDLKAGLWGGGDADTYFLLPKDSLLAPYLINRRKAYGAVDLSFLWDSPKAKRLWPCLQPTGKKGEYKFVHKARGGRCNTVVIADERYPNETTPPGSVAAFLEEYMLNGKCAG